MHSRPQEISLIFPTLGRNSILTWSQIMIKTPIAIAAPAATRTASSLSKTIRIKLGEFQREELQWVTT
jgi:hypothetical protein